MGSAAVNLVLRNEALPPLDCFRSGSAPLMFTARPMDMRGLGAGLEEISQAVGIPMSDEVRRALRERKKESMTYRMYAGMYRDRPHRPRPLWQGTMIPWWDWLGVPELDIPTDLMICAHSLKDVEEPMEGITHFPRERDQIDALRALDYHLVLADDVSLHLCDETNVGAVRVLSSGAPDSDRPSSAPDGAAGDGRPVGNRQPLL